MDKKQIIEEMKKYGFDLNKIRIATGAAMVLFGIREQTHDIDIGCEKSVIDGLVQQGCIAITLLDGSRKIELGEYIELFENWANYPTVMVEGLPCITIDSNIDLKRKLGREKDFKDISLMEDYKNTKKIK